MFFSCRKDYITVEMFEQEKKLIKKLSYNIETTNGIINLKYSKKIKMYPIDEIINMGYSSVEYSTDYDSLGETCYYSSIDKKIVIYFYGIKYGINTINSINTILPVKPFNNFKGFYTEYFIYNNYLYQVVSIYPNIKIEEMVEEFNYESIIQSGISQYKIIRQYTEEDSIIEKENMNNGKYSFFINYIFPEEINQLYKKYSWL
jgi:hypothetical protein